LLLILLKTVPDDRPWKPVLQYCAPALSLAVRRSVLWLVALLRVYVNDQRRLLDYRRGVLRLDRMEQELLKILRRRNLDEKNRAQAEEALSDISARRIEAVHGLNSPSGGS